MTCNDTTLQEILERMLEVIHKNQQATIQLQEWVLAARQDRMALAATIKPTITNLQDTIDNERRERLVLNRTIVKLQAQVNNLPRNDNYGEGYHGG